MFLFFAAFLSFGGVVTHSKLVTHCWLLVRYQQPQYIYTYIYNLYTTCMYLDYFECLRKRTLAVCCLAGCLKLHSSDLFFWYLFIAAENHLNAASAVSHLPVSANTVKHYLIAFYFAKPLNSIVCKVFITIAALQSAMRVRRLQTLGRSI